MIEYKKSSAILVFNDENKLLLQLRAINDESFPSHWDFSAGGGIDLEEEPEESAQRELREELGVVAGLKFLSQEHFKYPAWQPNVLREVDLFIYKTHHNGPFKIDTIEIEKVKFFTFEEVKNMLELSEKFYPEFILAWNKDLIL